MIDKELERDRIDALRRSESNTGYYAAGAIAPMLVLVNLVPFFSKNESDLISYIAFASIVFLSAAGFILLLYRVLHININRLKIELYLCDINKEYNIDIFGLKHWLWPIRAAFLFQLTGYFLLIYLIFLILIAS